MSGSELSKIADLMVWLPEDEMASYLQIMAIEYFLLPSACKVRNLNSSKKL